MKCVGLLFLLAASEFSYADALPEAQDRELARVLANFELLAETEYPKSALNVRVIRVQDPGECDGALATCPKATIYVAVSTYDEAPDQKVYQLPKAHGWSFEGFSELPKTDSPTVYAKLRLKAQRPIMKNGSEQWGDEFYSLSVNQVSGKWQKE